MLCSRIVCSDGQPTNSVRRAAARPVTDPARRGYGHARPAPAAPRMLQRWRVGGGRRGAGPRVVLVHDWLTGMRGGEKCLERLCRRWPDAPLYTLLHAAGSVSPAIEGRRVRTSFLQRLPDRERYYRYLLPLLPLAARWPLPACDLVVSLSHSVAKAALPPRGVPHVCYCFTPT